jgi:hypothetical protein
VTGRPWSPDTGAVTRAYDDWRLSEARLRTFFRLARDFSGPAYQAIWERLGAEPSDGEGPELIDLFEDEVDGLHQNDFDWQLSNLVIRDGVTLYEVYLEKVLYETVSFRFHGVEFRDKSPNWNQLRKVFDGVFGVPVDPKDVRDVIDLRDLLSHRQGELVTEALRQRYDTMQYDFPDVWVRLETDAVLNHLDTLAGAAAVIDRVMWPIAWGNVPVTHETHDALLLAAPWLYA